MRRHGQTEHGNNGIKECVYCRMAFISEEKFREHMKNQHELPDFQSSVYAGPLPTQTALQGNLKVIQLPVGGNELNLLNYLSNQKSEIQTIVKDQARSGPVKVGMSVCVKMVKDLETSIDEDGRQKRKEFWTNTQMQLIYSGNGLLDDEYWASVEKLLNCVTTFTLEGSGWRFESLSRFEIKFAQFAPIRPGSYIALPPKYSPHSNVVYELLYRTLSKTFSVLFWNISNSFEHLFCPFHREREREREEGERERERGRGREREREEEAVRKRWREREREEERTRERER